MLASAHLREGALEVDEGAEDLDPHQLRVVGELVQLGLHLHQDLEVLLLVVLLDGRVRETHQNQVSASTCNADLTRARQPIDRLLAWCGRATLLALMAGCAQKTGGLAIRPPLLLVPTCTCPIFTTFGRQRHRPLRREAFLEHQTQQQHLPPGGQRGEA